MSFRVNEFIQDVLDGKIPDGGRHITMVVLHHTWNPDHAQWAGDASAHAVRDYWLQQTKANGWKYPLGGHLIVAPNGTIYLPFDDFSLPVNADSNLDANHHGIAIEMVGDFDKGRDVFQNPQRHSVLGAVGALLVHYKLDTASGLFFHRSFESYKSCPGTGLDLAELRTSAVSSMSWVKETFKWNSSLAHDPAK